MARSFRRRYLKPAAAPAFDLPPPLPGAVVDAVLRYNDVQQDLGGGRSLLRLSPARLRQREVRAALGAAAERAAGVAILWNDREDEIIRVFDGGASPLAA